MYRVEIWFDNQFIVDAFTVDTLAEARQYKHEYEDQHTLIFILKV